MMENLGYIYGNYIELMLYSTDLNNLDTNVSLYFIELTLAGTISLNNLMQAGQNLTLILFNNSETTILQNLPNTDNFISLDGDTIEIPAKEYVEISILCFRSPSEDNKPCYIISSK